MAETGEPDRRFHLLADATKALFLNEHPAPTLGSIFANLGSELGLEVFFNYVLEEGGQRMRLQSYVGVSAETARDIEWLAVGAAVCGTVAATRKRRIEERLQRHKHDLCSLVRSFGVRAYACFPLLGRERLIGTLSFGTRQRDRFEAAEIELLEAISHLVAVGLEMGQLVDDLRARTRHLERMVAERDEHIGIMSHELKNPLAVVSGGAELLRRHKHLGAEERDVVLEDIAKHSDRAFEVMEKLLTISRARSGSELPLEPVHVWRLAQETIDEFHSLAPSRTICFDGAAQPIALGVETYVREILSNLLSNADKYTPPGTPIDVGISVDRDQTIISVRDYGPGVSPRQLGQIFHRFYRAPNTSSTAEGSGLGLTVCRRLVEVQGGRIEARLPHGGGLEVTFFLPRYEHDQDAASSIASGLGAEARIRTRAVS